MAAAMYRLRDTLGRLPGVQQHGQERWLAVRPGDPSDEGEKKEKEELEEKQRDKDGAGDGHEE